MDLRDLVEFLLAYDALAARQWVADAARSGYDWSRVPRPADLDSTASALAAGVTELMAARSGKTAPVWTAFVSAAPERIFLVRSAATMPRLRALCEQEGPEPLRRRGFFAPPEFLTAV